MKTLIPSASACFVVVFVASVGYAESQIDETNRDTANAQVEQELVDKPQALEEDSPDAGSSERRELSVAPLDHLTFPENRPGWLDAEPDLESDIHTWVVTTGAHDSYELCESELQVLKKAAVALYIQRLTGWECGDDLLNEDWIENELVAPDPYLGELTQGEQTLKEMGVKLQFDEQARKKIRAAWKNAQVGERLQAAGGLFALSLIGLCLTGGMLNLFSRRFA